MILNVKSKQKPNRKHINAHMYIYPPNIQYCRIKLTKFQYKPVYKYQHLLVPHYTEHIQPVLTGY